MATSSAFTQAIYMVNLFDDLGFYLSSTITIYCNNTNIVSMIKNPKFHSQRKHIDIHHHFMQDLVKDGFIKLRFYPSKDQLIYIFTEEFPKDQFLNIYNHIKIQTIKIMG